MTYFHCCHHRQRAAQIKKTLAFGTVHTHTHTHTDICTSTYGQNTGRAHSNSFVAGLSFGWREFWEIMKIDWEHRTKNKNTKSDSNNKWLFILVHSVGGHVLVLYVCIYIYVFANMKGTCMHRKAATDGTITGQQYCCECDATVLHCAARLPLARSMRSYSISSSIAELARLVPSKCRDTRGAKHLISYFSFFFYHSPKRLY